MATILITGATRGIGLGMVKHVLEQNGPIKVVIATYRKREKADSLFELKNQYSNLHLLQLDVSKLDSFAEFKKEVEAIVGENGVNVLYNNAGVSGEGAVFPSLTPEGYINTFNVNTFGPVFLIQTLLPLIQMASRKNSSKSPGISRGAIINISSILGSVSQNVSGGVWSYRESKAALNQFSRSLAKALSPDNIIVTVLHPGHVRTDMGGPSGKISVEESVTGIYRIMLSLDQNKSDKFYQYDGSELLW